MYINTENEFFTKQCLYFNRKMARSQSKSNRELRCNNRISSELFCFFLPSIDRVCIDQGLHYDLQEGADISYEPISCINWNITI